MKKKYNLPILITIIFLDSFSYFIVIPILLELFYAHNYHIIAPQTANATRDMLISITLAISPITALIFAPIIGSLSDKYGRKKLMLVCLFSICLGFLLPVIGIIKKNLYLIWLGRFTNGIGTISQPIAQATISDNSRGLQKAHNLSLIAFAMTLSIVLGPLAGGYLSKNYLANYLSISLPYLVAFAFTLIVFLFTWFYFEDTLSNKNAPKTTLSITKIGRPAIALFFSFFALEFAWSGYYQSIFFYLTHVFNYSPQQIGLFNAYIGIVMAVGLIAIYPILIKIFKIRHLLYANMLILFISFSICCISINHIIELVVAGIIALTTGISYTCLVTIISDYMSLHHQGKTFGFASTLLFLAWTITAFLGSVMFHIYSLMPFYVAALTMLLAIISLGYYRKLSKRG